MRIHKLDGNFMGQKDCYRITPDRVPWSSDNRDGAKQRDLFSSAVVRLREHELAAAAQWSAFAGNLYLVTAGEIKLRDGQKLIVGDLYWCTAGDQVLMAGDCGTTFYSMEPLQGFGREMPSQTIVGANLSWEEFEDPAGRPTQPVQVLMEGSLSALRTRFDPNYSAGEHWHDFDTLYFITRGRMQFGAEGWFEQGEIRAVHGGHSYGPEQPGTDGVEFVLVSVGGPVALHWSDLEPPP